MPLREVLFGASVANLVSTTLVGTTLATSFHPVETVLGTRLPLECKNPRLSGGGFWLREPDDYLLSHGNPHYHRRRVVSRSCSGWEGVGPTRYGHQAKRVVLLAWPTEPIWEEAVILSCVYHTRESNMSLWIAASAFARRRSTRQTCYRIKPYGQLVSVS